MMSSRPFTCTECTQTFTRNENLERHKRSRHGSDSRRPFKCENCKARFTRKDVCKRHAERCRGTFSRVLMVAGIQNGAEQPAPAFEDTALSPDDQDDSPFSTSQEGVIAGVGDDTIYPNSPPEAAEVPDADELLVTEIMTSGTETYVSTYFENFHPSFPLVHRQSLGNELPKLSKQIIVSIGMLYASRNVSEEETASLTRKSQTLWNHGHDELWRVVEADWREIRRTWVMQAWLLHIIYGAFTGNASDFDKSKKMLRWIVDAARDLGLLRQNVFQSTSRFRDSEEQTLHDHWISYVESESMKLSMYTLLFLDFHIFSPCNIRPLTTPTELDWELPLASSLWEADTSLAWAQRLGDEPRTVGLTRSHDTPGMTCPTTKSLNLAMQSLMTDTPSPQLLAALRASPMATLFVLTSLDSLVRDFTRCYYQLPPALADPNAYHILTQSQNRQVSAALRYVSEIITTQIAAADSSNWHILNFAERIALSVKLALCKPDDLLIGGIVENSVVAGLTTATHLTMGLQVGARRSLQNLLRYNSGDDGMLIFLDDLMDVLSSVTSIERQDPLREAPWATVATYKILLAIWRLLRWATGEMRRKSGTQPTVRTRFEASTIVFNSILEVLQRQEDIDGQTRRLSVRESTALGMASEASEVRFMETVLQFWKGRPVWAMGSFMTTVLEEVISAGGMAYE
ncbi:zinc finger protein ADR1 [Colletotrichum paranaense]|uniref:Zinc finger protein ADR1 n=1 Tax=Colletotrichum paranaense TaxID=1914294 RepID=A0ABQ9S312_9PEZI|nr:zinc finger protein ADR1 [Colletotrichum paranaense]KAK1523192.1 zinc finger protein ADR1 [Colletotrichum paranaense]